MSSSSQSASGIPENNPLLLDIKDIERDILMLEKTIRELKELVENGTVPEEDAQDLRLVIVENEFAVEEKLRRRKTIREALGLGGEDEFHRSRLALSSLPERSAEESTLIEALRSAKDPISLGAVDDVSGIIL